MFKFTLSGSYTYFDRNTCSLFGIDDFIGGLLGGGLKMLSNAQQNQASSDQAAQNQMYTQQNMGMSQAFNAQQADISRQFSAGQQVQAEQFNSAEAEANRRWQERMSSTAYQRSRADMQAAGLNPILAAGAGGASTPSGSMGSVGPVSGATAQGGALPGGSGPSRVGLFQDVLSSAREAARLEPELAKTRSEESLNRGIETRTAAERALKLKETDLTAQQVETEKERQANLRKEREKMQSDMDARSKVSVGIHGVTADPQYYADKLANGIHGVQSWASNAVPSFVNSAKNYWNMIKPEGF